MSAKVRLNRHETIGEVDKRIYSGFIEHLGRAVYSGIFQPGHASADEDGFRRDVLELIRMLDMPLTRYPGGNFVSAYRWEDGIGPVEKRPARLDYAWKAIEPNTFGLDEFMKWCRKAKTEPIMAVNLGTRGASEAMDLAEYCNFKGGTYWSDLRKQNGAEAPYNIRYWCLGNEMDGPWQAGHTTARAYGALAREAGKLIRGISPEAEFIVCGSSSAEIKTFPEWDREVLEETYEIADFIALHRYFANDRGTAEFLTAPEKMASQIETIVCTCDYVKALKRSAKTIDLSFDEWNIWFRSKGKDKNSSSEWTVGRDILEDIYTMEDALVCGGLLCTLQNHCDRVKIACLAQTVNVIAPIMTSREGGAWKQTIFYPFLYASRYGRGVALKMNIESGSYECGGRNYPYLVGSAILNEDRGELTVFAVNRNLEAPLPLKVTLENLNAEKILEFVSLHHADLLAENREHEEKVRPEIRTDAVAENGTVSAMLPAASWNMIRVKIL